jgi:prevent-host-death family protein
MRTIGIRELRQRASEYIRLVESGETIEVTDRGRPVAMITPIKPALTEREQLALEGKLILAEGPRGPYSPVPLDPQKPTLSEILQQMRDEERY